MGGVLDQIADVWGRWDDLCSENVRRGFVKLGWAQLLLPPAEPLADQYFVASPTPIVTAILLYLAIIGVSLVIKPASPKAEGKDSRVLRICVQAHNAFLIVLSSYMCIEVIRQAIRNRYNFWGNEFKPSEVGMARIIYIFYLSKMYEFLDTMIMIVKGNMRQVTFLHVYHHVSVSLIWWALAYVAPGGDAYYSAWLNSLVHVCMYTYYFLATSLGKDKRRRDKWLWWGRYLTMFQMTQFVTMLTQAIYCLITDSYNAFACKLLVVYMITLLTLFGNFFLRKYSSQRGSKAASNGHAADARKVQ